MSRTAVHLEPDELAALALLVDRHRTRTGHPPWDRGTIAAQLTALEHDWPTALATALAAADDPRADTPYAITWPRHQPAAKSKGSTSRAPTCRTCQLPEQACRRMSTRTPDPHDFDTSRSTR